jgi:hypothetical protein
MEDIPPNEVKTLAISFGDTVVRLAEIVERKHTIFLLDVPQDDFPIVVIIEFGGEDIVREDEMLGDSISGGVCEREVSTTNLVVIVEESHQDLLVGLEREPLVDILAIGLHIGGSDFGRSLELAPNGIVGLLKEERVLVGRSLGDDIFVMPEFIFVSDLAEVGASVCRCQMVCTFQQLRTLLPTFLPILALEGEGKITMYYAKYFH